MANLLPKLEYAILCLNSRARQKLQVGNTNVIKGSVLAELSPKRNALSAWTSQKKPLQMSRNNSSLDSLTRGIRRKTGLSCLIYPRQCFCSNNGDASSPTKKQTPRVGRNLIITWVVNLAFAAAYPVSNMGNSTEILNILTLRLHWQVGNETTSLSGAKEKINRCFCTFNKLSSHHYYGLSDQGYRSLVQEIAIHCKAPYRGTPQGNGFFARPYSSGNS